MISIVDYGLGNVLALENIYRRLNIPVNIVSSAKSLAGSKQLILPGVGSFDWAMTRLNNSGLRPELERLVIEEGVPVLGICIGMHLMADRSEEGQAPGLGWIQGKVKQFKISDQLMRLPHMGWNNLFCSQNVDIFDLIDQDAEFYFLHSYYFDPVNQVNCISKTEYYGLFSSGIRKNNIYGVQFHPEKSHKWGVRLLKNFAEIDTC